MRYYDVVIVRTTRNLIFSTAEVRLFTRDFHINLLGQSILRMFTQCHLGSNAFISWLKASS